MASMVRLACLGVYRVVTHLLLVTIVWVKIVHIFKFLSYELEGGGDEQRAQITYKAIIILNKKMLYDYKNIKI